VVDNGSSDDTGGLIRREHKWARLIELGENLGAAARTVGAREAESPYVAFSDDDSWWAPGALALAADRIDVHPRLALIAARVLVGASEALDPTCKTMAASPLPRADDLPGPPVLGFLACGAVVRRSAFLDVGGFEPRFGVGGEEDLLAIDLASAGWGLAYCDDVVAHHYPRAGGPRPGRRRVEVRNALWTAWLRLPPMAALRRTLRTVSRGARDGRTWLGLWDALLDFPWVVRQRRRVPPWVGEALMMLAHGPNRT
jgi:N-acetylglucosaminyl-diphospho-decaprenol L-rhamnosyltransferase